MPINQQNPIPCYRLGCWQVDSVNNTLISEQTTNILEPKSMAILCYFIAHPHQIITRQTLFEQFWPNQVVSDDALNRAISNIRRNLGDSSTRPQYLATIRNQGYKFLVAAIPIEEPSTDDNQPKFKGSTKAYILATIGLCTFFAVLVIINTKPTNEYTQPTIDKRKRLSYDNAQNIMAKRSSDGQYLTFIAQSNHKPSNRRQANLKFRPFNQTYAQAIGDKNKHYSYPVFGTNNQIAAIQSDQNSSHIVIFDPLNTPISSTTLLTLSTPSIGLDWHPQSQTMVYSNPHPISGKNSIYRVISVLGHTSKPTLITDANQALADNHPNLSPTGARISFVRQHGIKQFQLVTTDIHGKILHKSQQYSAIHSFDWVNDNQLVLFADNMQISIDLNDIAKTISTQATKSIPYYVQYQPDTKSLIYSDIQTSSQVYSYPLDSTAQKHQLTLSQTQDSQAVVSNDSYTLAFVSNRTGQQQLWLRTNNTTYPIEHSWADQLFDLNFSPDTTTLAAIAKVGQHYWLYQYKLSNQQLSKQSLTSASRLVAWRNNQQLLMTQQHPRNNQWHLYQRNSQTHQQRQLSTLNIQQAKLTPDKRRLVFRNNQSNTLWLFDWQNHAQPLTNINDLQQNWFIDDDNLYYSIDNQHQVKLYRQAFAQQNAIHINTFANANLKDRHQRQLYHFINSASKIISADIWSEALVKSKPL